MRYQVDHDLHIHSYISPCLGHDVRQTPEAILSYGLSSDFRLVCVTDHIADRKVETPCWNWAQDSLDLERGRKLLPLPQSDYCRFLLGMEVDMDYMGNFCVSKEEMESFDFLILAPSHLHMGGFTIDKKVVDDSAEAHKKYYLERMDQILKADLPFEKCGLAHFTTCLVCPKEPIRVFELFSDGEYEEMFGRVAEKGMGVELNFREEWNIYQKKKEREEILRPFRIAKKMGCRFYLGSDSHSPEEFWGQRAFFEQVVDLLNLQEEDKFPFVIDNEKKCCK